MKKKNIWMAVVNHTDSVVFAKGCSTKQQAETAIVKYLQKNEEFDGKDFGEACFWIGEKDLRLDLQVFQMKLKDFEDVKLSAGLPIEPPPKEKDLYRVVYVIDITACSPLDAAQKTERIMTAPDSLAPFLEIINQRGKVTKFDLSKID